MRQLEIMQRHVFANETIRNYAVLNISPFLKERVCMHDSLASNHERGIKERHGVGAKNGSVRRR